jgi:hypothetical protein
MSDGGKPALAAMEVVPVIKRTGRAERLAVAKGEDIAAQVVERLDVTHEGIPGDRHAGFTRAADVRVPWFPRGVPIHNERHLSIVSTEELAIVAGKLGIERLEPEWVGANLAVSGITAFSYLPRGTRLFFPSGAVLCVTDQNAPCRIAGAEIARHLPGHKDLTLRFSPAAKRLRGVVAYVDRPGALVTGDSIAVRVPEQWLWRE